MFKTISLAMVCVVVTGCASTMQNKLHDFEGYIYSPEYKDYTTGVVQQNAPQSMRGCKTIAVDDFEDKIFWVEEDPVFKEGAAFGEHHPVKGRWGERQFGSGCGQTFGVQVIHEAVPGKYPDLRIKYFKGVKREEFLKRP